MAKYEFPPGNVGGLFEVGMRFRDWADRQPTTWSYLDVMNDFGVCRATAFRWVASWRAVNGLPDTAHTARNRYAA